MEKPAKIQKISALEILDSRGNPTIETEVTLQDKTTARASVPSGSSTGINEALELRDQDSRYNQKGVKKAVQNVNQLIAPEIQNMNPQNQAQIDQKLIKLDGTENKEKLGANAILSVSTATLKAAAKFLQIPVYQYIAILFGETPQTYTLPVPLMNILNGGKHAQNLLDFQEYMIVPHSAPNFAEAVRWGSETFHSLAKILKSQNLSTAVGDEGGYAPLLSSNEEPLQLIVQAIEKAGYQPDKDISIALDPAASEFFQEGKYYLKTEEKTYTTKDMVALYTSWVEKYPIVSIEDGLAEEDWQGFSLLTQKLGDKVQIVGDDLFVTNSKFLKKGIDLKAANSILIKPNQIGTITETLETIKLAHNNSLTTIISHRSGDTEDPFIADLAVGTGAGQIKTGSLSRSERTAKYNQILRIENNLDQKSKLAKFPFA